MEGSTDERAHWEHNKMFKHTHARFQTNTLNIKMYS